jgi:hypothetical protein
LVVADTGFFGGGFYSFLLTVVFDKKSPASQAHPLAVMSAFTDDYTNPVPDGLLAIERALSVRYTGAAGS